MRVDGKVVLVTGGASGIGAALCRRLGRERPAGVAVADLDIEGAQRTAAAVEATGAPALAVAADVGREADVQAMVAATVARFGPVDNVRRKAADPDRWLAGMRRLVSRAGG